MEGEIHELYNFDYTCVYHIDDNIQNEKQYKHDLLQIISRPPNDELYYMKLYGIFTILNKNKDTKYIFDLLRKKIKLKIEDKVDDDPLNIIILFYESLTYDFLYLYHPCICDIYHDNAIKPENLNRLLSKLDTL